MAIKGIILLHDQIDLAISDFDGCQIKEKQVIVAGHAYTLDIGGKIAKLRITHSKGKSTITHELGKHKNVSHALALHIQKECEVKTSGKEELKNGSFYIKKIREEDFNSVIEFLLEKGATEERKVNPNSLQITINGAYGDKLVFKFHTNKSFQVQGKPGLLFHQTIEILSEVLPFKEVIEEQLKFYDSNISSGELLSAFENRMPTAFKMMHNNLKAIISPSLALIRIEGLELTDFSFITFPALRGLEGVIKQLFSPEYVIRSDESFNGHFERHGIKSILKVEFRNGIDNSVRCKCIEDAYNYFKLHRHRLFHCDAVSENITIITKEEAERIVGTVYNIVEQIYLDLSKIMS